MSFSGTFRAEQTMAEIADLPEEVLLKIFNYLDPATVKAVSLVSR